MKTFQSMVLSFGCLLGLLAADVAQARGANSGYWGRNGRRGGGSSDSSGRSDRDGRGGGGGSDSDRARPARGTAAWFLGESLEHFLRHFQSTQPDLLNDAVSFEVALTTVDRSHVAVRTASAPLLETNCSMVDSTRRGGSEIRKDVNCAAGQGRADLPRNSRAGLLVEALEHSLRAEFASDATIAQLAARATGAFGADGLIGVELFLANNVRIAYTCTPESSGSVNCRK